MTDKIICKNCGSTVLEGKIEKVWKDGREKRIFKSTMSPRGIILTKGKSDPRDWKGLCSKCQSEKS